MRPDRFLWALALGGFLLPGVPVQGQPGVANHDDGSEVRYPVVLLKGTVSESASTIRVINESSDRDEREIEGRVRQGRFKGLAELVEGENRLLPSFILAEREWMSVGNWCTQQTVLSTH